MQQKFLQQAHADLPVYLTDVYRDFQKTGTRPFHLRLTLYDGTARSFPLQLPPADCTEEAAFLAEYIHFSIIFFPRSARVPWICILIPPIRRCRRLSRRSRRFFSCIRPVCSVPDTESA